MLTCKELSERATDYLENTLSIPQRASIKMHLLMCKHCRAYVDQLAKTVSLLKAAVHRPADASPDAAIMAILRGDLPESKT